MKYYLDNMRGAAERCKATPDTQLMDNAPSTFAFYWAAAGKTHRCANSRIQAHPIWRASATQPSASATAVPCLLCASCTLTKLIN